MGKRRTMEFQLERAIKLCFKPGRKKASLSDDEKTYVITSLKSKNDMVSFAKRFGKWIHEHHPEILYVKDIQTEHVQKYFSEREKGWRNKTKDEYRSRFKKLSAIINHAYGANTDFTVRSIHEKDELAIRNLAMTENDYILLSKAMHESNSKAAYAVDLAYKGGLRVNEVAHFRGSFIDMKKKQLILHENAGTKNGRFREVAMLPEDITFWKQIKETFGEDLVCSGVKAGSINAAIRRCLKKIGLYEKYTKEQDTSVHAIRKGWCRRWRRYLVEEQKMSEEDAWKKVVPYLGHGTKRHELMKIYWNQEK